MSNTQEKEVGKIYETKDYGKFKTLSGNRHIDRNHVKLLKRQIQAGAILAPANVNSKNGIQDGQHRFTACMECGEPFRYYIGKDLSPEEIARMNNSTKKWSNSDYASSYAGQGNENYRLYKAFRLQFPDFPHVCVLLLLLNNSVRETSLERSFREGTFAIHNWTKAVKMGNILMSIKEFTTVYRRQGFILAFLQLMDLKEFNLDRMMRKLYHKGQTIKDFAQKEDFIKVLEEIYNWKEPAAEKVRFF